MYNLRMSKSAPDTAEHYRAGDGRYAIVAARWHPEIMDRLIAGAQATLLDRGAAPDRIDLFRVPGSFELPIASDRLARSARYVAVIALGVVVQGETQHHDYINMSVANGLSQAALNSGVPILFGVLTCHTMEQAHDRAGGQAGNKGVEAALAAVEMVQLMSSLPPLA